MKCILCTADNLTAEIFTGGFEPSSKLVRAVKTNLALSAEKSPTMPVRTYRLVGTKIDPWGEIAYAVYEEEIT